MQTNYFPTPGSFTGPAHIPATITIPVVLEPAPENIVTFTRPTKIADALEAWEQLTKKYEADGIYLDKFVVTFDKPVTLQVNRRKRRVVKKAELRFFVSRNQAFCYTFNRRSGYWFEHGHAEALVSIEAVLPDQKRSKMVKQVMRLATRIHPNAWTDLKHQVISEPGKFADNYGPAVTSIKSKFPDYVIERLREAFEKKVDYSYRQDSRGHSGRTLSVQTKLCEDGIFRGWFSSEYPGCANGDYWILANPTTAIFREKD